LRGKELAQLVRWYQSATGRQCLRFFETALHEHWSPAVRSFVLQLGDHPIYSFFSNDDSLHGAFSVLPHRSADSVAALYEALPFKEHSFDAVVLPHVLEYVRSPQEVLAESMRVLKPEGVLLIMGFNPYSLWGLFHLVLRFTATQPWGGRLLGLGKLRSFLSQLDCIIDVYQTDCYRLPFLYSRDHDRTGFLDLFGRFCFPFSGGVYFLIARKQEVGATLIRPDWSLRKWVVGKRFLSNLFSKL